MFSDDVIVDSKALEIISKTYETNDCKWAFSGFCGTKDGVNTYDHRVPRWTEHTLEGRNLLSSPSVVSFLNECKIEFDENLKLLSEHSLLSSLTLSKTSMSFSDSSISLFISLIDSNCFSSKSSSNNTLQRPVPDLIV